jgi:hypothetical protein
MCVASVMNLKRGSSFMYSILETTSYPDPIHVKRVGRLLVLYLYKGSYDRTKDTRVVI